MRPRVKKACRITLTALLCLFLAVLLTAVGLLLYWKVNLPGWFAAPAKGEIHRDVVYKNVDGRALHMDIYQPGRRLFTQSPAVFYYHGGSWNSGDKELDDDDVVKAVLDYGLTIVSVEYRLTDDSTVYPAFLDDCADAIRFVAAHAAEYGVDKNRFCAFGASAGGQISLMMALAGTDYGSDEELAGTDFHIKCGVALCAPTDFLNLDVYEEEEDRKEAAELLQALFGGTVEELPGAYRDASPINHIHKKAPPLFMAHGTKDDIVPIAQAASFVEAAEKAGMAVEYHPVENANHKFKAAGGLAVEPSVDEVLKDMTEFLIWKLIL